MQALDINMPDLVAMLGVLACAAVAGWIGLRIAALFRKNQLNSLPDLLATTAVLIVLATMFFNHQRVRLP